MISLKEIDTMIPTDQCSRVLVCSAARQAREADAQLDLRGGAGVQSVPRAG